MSVKDKSDNIFRGPYIRGALSKRLYLAGLSYYRSGYVKKVARDEDNALINVLVQGKRNDSIYHVKMTRRDDKYDIVCDCPTAEQPCKHSIASALAIEDLDRFGRYQKSSFHPIFRVINFIRRFRH